MIVKDLTFLILSRVPGVESVGKYSHLVFLIEAIGILEPDWCFYGTLASQVKALY